MKSLISLAQSFEKSLIEKNIKPTEDISPECKNNLAKYVAMLRGLYIIHQDAHLMSKSQEFYGDHLLFQKLYEETEEHIDQAFEKIIGNFGEDCANLKLHIENTHNFITDACNASDDLVERSLLSELSFIKFSKELHSMLEKKSLLSFGMDDLITAVSGMHEDFIYLLKQRNS